MLDWLRHPDRPGQARAAALILAGIGGLMFVALLFGGGQVSSILSTVGSSIGSGPLAGAAGSTGSGSAGTGTNGGGSGGLTGGGQPAANGAPRPVVDAARPDLLVIRTGTMTLEVAAIEPAIATAAERISALGGYVSGSEQSASAGGSGASVTYRVPSANWDAALVAIRGVGTKVLAEQTKTEDVTAQVVDLGARISNLQATERALQAIMSKAGSIKDILAVEAQLSDIRGQIEQATAQRNQLAGQAALSTLTVTYGLKAAPVVVATPKPAATFDPGTEVSRATARLVDNLHHVEAAGIWFGIVWLPFLAAVVAGLVVVLLLARWLRQRRPPEPAIEG